MIITNDFQLNYFIFWIITVIEDFYLECEIIRDLIDQS